MPSKTPTHILKLSTEQKRVFLDSFDSVFSDIDGVVFNVYAKIDGAPDGYRELERAGKPIRFLTNNSASDPKFNEKRFKDAGLSVDNKDIWHPSKCIVKYLKNRNFEGLIYVIGTESFKNVLREAGFQVIDGPNHFVDESFTEMGKVMFDKQPVRAVVIDNDFNVSAVKLIRAQVYLLDPECLFIAGATDMTLHVRANLNIIGPGAFIKILEDSTKNKLITIGKPGAALGELIRKEHGITDPRRALMIGDTLKQDIGFGTNAGFQTLAVLSGVCKLQDLQAETNPSYIPDYYADSMGDFIEFMNDIRKSSV